jgi:hypothetical protein
MVFAGTFDSGNNAIKISLLDSTLYSINTLRRRAPFEVLAIVNISANKQFLVTILRLAKAR